jgi:proline dehydrogenase
MPALNRVVVAALELVPPAILWRFARRYVAGPTLPEALRVVRRLTGRRLTVTLDILGEHVSSTAEARADGEAYREALRAIHRDRLPCSVSVKPTHMGLKLDRSLCLEILRGIATEAAALGNFVRLDMEDATCTDDTLALHEALRGEGGPVGVVLQAYLRRSEADARRLAEGRANVRLCKGIYRESPAIAYQDRQTIRERFLALLEILLRGGCFVGIATHDAWLLREARRLIARLGLSREASEFQMLLGVREDLRDRLLDEGERVRIYLPYGEKWRAYCLRRFRENPQLLRTVLLAVVRRSG